MQTIYEKRNWLVSPRMKSFIHLSCDSHKINKSFINDPSLVCCFTQWASLFLLGQHMLLIIINIFLTCTIACYLTQELKVLILLKMKILSSLTSFQTYDFLFFFFCPYNGNQWLSKWFSNHIHIQNIFCAEEKHHTGLNKGWQNMNFWVNLSWLNKTLSKHFFFWMHILLYYEKKPSILLLNIHKKIQDRSAPCNITLYRISKTNGNKGQKQSKGAHGVLSASLK